MRAVLQPHRNIVIQNNVLYGADADIKEFVRKRIPNSEEGFAPDATALGVLRHGKLVGGVVYDRFGETNGHKNIFMSAAMDDPRWASRKVLRELYGYPFLQLGCRRMTTVTTFENKAALEADLKMGFQIEGVLRCLFPGDVDGVVLGMLREECRWI